MTFLLDEILSTKMKETITLIAFEIDQRAEKAVEYEADGDTYYNWCLWNILQKVCKRAWGNCKSEEELRPSRLQSH